MKKKYLLIPSLVVCLTSCSKTNLLYKENAYNSPIFDENYYTDRADIDSLEIQNTLVLAQDFHSEDGLGGLSKDDIGDYVWNSYEKEKMYGYHNNLDSIEESFNYGILSKLYDGRVRCDGYFQLSRVQLNKTGYATYFPKTLYESTYFAFACRGGTTLEKPMGCGPTFDSKNPAMKFNFIISFYLKINNSIKYDKISFVLKNVNVQVDNGGNTNLVSFYLPFAGFLQGAVAMSMEFECVDERMTTYNLTDDYQDKEKDHLALMLYEVFLPKSTWY